MPEAVLSAVSGLGAGKSEFRLWPPLATVSPSSWSGVFLAYNTGAMKMADLEPLRGVQLTFLRVNIDVLGSVGRGSLGATEANAEHQAS